MAWYHNKKLKKNKDGSYSSSKSKSKSSRKSSGSSSRVSKSTASSKAEALQKLGAVTDVSEGIKKQTAVEEIKEKQRKSKSSSPTKEQIKAADLGNASRVDVETGQPKAVSEQENIVKNQTEVSKENIVKSQISVTTGRIEPSPKRNVYQKTEDKLSFWYEEASKPSSDVSPTRVAKGTVGFIGSAALSYAKGILYDIPKGIYTTIRHPVKTAKGVYKLATDKQTRDTAIYQLGSEFKINPAKSIGSFASIVTAPQVYGKTAGKVKDVYVKVGSTPIDDTAVFSQEVLAGKKIMPLSKGTKSALKRFNVADESGKVTVQTSSPAKIKGKTVGTGRKIGLEDPGIYTTPAKEGSPYFLRVSSDITPAYSYSLNPFKDMFGVPTVTRFKINKVVTYPKSILKKPGFSQIDDFQRASVGKGQAYITKRSMIGQGELPSKKFKAPVDLKLDNMKVKAGQVVKEAGTSEIEAVIGVGEKFKYTPKTKLGKLKGFDYYTNFEGRAIAVRDATLITSKNAGKISPKGVTIQGGRIASETSALSSSVINPTISPYPSVFAGISRLPSNLSANRLQSTPLKEIKNDISGLKKQSDAFKKSDIISNKLDFSFYKAKDIQKVSSIGRKKKSSRRKSSKPSSIISPISSSPTDSSISPRYSKPPSSKISPNSYKPRKSKKSSSSSSSSSFFSGFSYPGSSIGYSSSSITSIPNILLPPTPKPFFKMEKSGLETKKKKKKKQLRLLTPTARAAVFGLKGTTTKGSVLTGLGERYVSSKKGI